MRCSSYRPFCKQWLYFSRQFNERVLRIPEFYPDSDSENLTICTTGPGASVAFSALITKDTPNFHFQDSSQCFSLYSYSGSDEPLGLNLGIESGKALNISSASVKSFRETYQDTKITAEDIFYYVYGIFHSSEYKERFSSDLNKMMPRIPFAMDFWAFCKAGKSLATLHLNYENVTPYPLQEVRDELSLDETKLYQVEKMRFGKSGKEIDKTKIQYNSHVILTGIPLTAYEYVVNGRPAIECIMERYQLTKDKESGVMNNPNDWAKEHDDPKYVINLLKRIVTVSLETMKIVKALPPLNEKIS